MLFDYVRTSILSQTLSTLHLSGDEIGDTGVEHLAAALRVHELSQIFFMLIIISLSPSQWSQSLTTLNLSRNQIGAEGAKYRAAALKVNRVRQIFFKLSIHLSVTIVTDTQNTRS